MRPKKRLIMSICEPNITKMLMLEKEFSNRYDLSIAEAPYVAQLLAQAQREPADLFGCLVPR